MHLLFSCQRKIKYKKTALAGQSNYVKTHFKINMMSLNNYYSIFGPDFHKGYQQLRWKLYFILCEKHINIFGFES